MIRHVWAICFSPNKSTAKITETIAEQAARTLGLPGIEIHDWTLPEQRKTSLLFTEEDLVISGTPTYAGRIPNKAMPYLRDSIRAENALAVSVTTYGNRAYTDSLLEQALLLQDNGFRYIGGAAVVTEHSMTKELGKGRPFSEEWTALADFGIQVGTKAQAVSDGSISYHSAADLLPGNRPIGPYYRPLEADGSPADFLKAAPALNKETCTGCGVCADVCPMGSISKDDPSVLTGICIKCHACINSCRSRSRYFDHPSLLSHIEMLKSNFSENLPANEYYL